MGKVDTFLAGQGVDSNLIDISVFKRMADIVVVQSRSPETIKTVSGKKRGTKKECSDRRFLGRKDEALMEREREESTENILRDMIKGLRELRFDCFLTYLTRFLFISGSISNVFHPSP